jgi:hypothetical protein
MLRSIQESLSGMRGRVSGSGGPLRLLLGIAISIVLLVAAFWIVDRVFVFFLARSYVDEIADALEINKYLANAISWVAFAVTVFLFGLTFSLSRRKRRLGVLGVLALLVGQSLVLWYGTKRNIIDRCYVITKDVAQPVRFGNHPGTVDQETGRICRPVTPEIVDRLRSYEKGEVPKRIEVAEPTFFDPRTAEAIVWYSKTSGGSVELFNLMGFHPRTGDELLPVTKEIAALWKTQSQAPKRVFPDGSYQFFDLTTGESRLWYLLALNGEFEFYDRAGFSPLTGQR